MTSNTIEMEYQEHSFDTGVNLIEQGLRSRKTVLEMLGDRGVDLTGGFFGGGLKLKADNEIRQLSDLNFTIGKQLLVFWSNEEKMSVEHARTFLVQLEEAGIKRGILILQTKLNVYVRKAMKNVLRQGYVIEIFYIHELLFNFSHHAMIPKHTVLNEEEVRELMTQYSVDNLLQFPKMVSTDPMARYLGLRPGQVVCMDRAKLQDRSVPSPPGSYLSYRMVVFHREVSPEEEVYA